jgi:hypothetical protein
MGHAHAGNSTLFHARAPWTRALLLLALALTLIGALGAGVAKAEDESSNTVAFSCNAITFKYTGFPNANGNTVLEQITVDGTKEYVKDFTFNGPTGENTVKLPITPGFHKVDARTSWATNGARGGRDIPDRGGVTCEADPELTIVKKQHFAPKGEFVKTVLPGGKVGETVDYEMIVTNTGNVPLALSPIEDPKCDPGTIAGGPGEAELAVAASTTYTCTHKLTAADQKAGVYTNTASIEATPPPSSHMGVEANSAPLSVTSNTVVVELPTPENSAGFSCSSVTYTFTGFPNEPGNTVLELIHVDGSLFYEGTFTFNGSFGTNTIPLNLSPGHHKVDARSRWKTNGFKGGRDIKLNKGITCAAAPEPSFDISKDQEIAGSESGFTSAPLTAKVGQTDDYRITVTNTGNVPITLSSFSDPNCDPGTIAGGPSGAIEPSTSTTYTCSKLLSGVGSFSNTASVTGTPPVGDGSAVNKSSNTVSVEVPAEPGFSLVKEQSLGEAATTAPISGHVGETVTYVLTITNTGNVPLSFSEAGLTDAHCDPGTRTGVFSGEVAPGQSQVAGTCSHELTTADAEAGQYENTATETGTPPEGEGTPLEVSSNTVITEASFKPV